MEIFAVYPSLGFDNIKVIFIAEVAFCRDIPSHEKNPNPGIKNSRNIPKVKNPEKIPKLRKIPNPGDENPEIGIRDLGSRKNPIPKPTLLYRVS